EDLRGKPVAYVAGWPEGNWLRENYPDIEAVSVKDTLEGLNAVAFGRTAALVSFLPTAQHYIVTEAMTNLRIAGRTPLTFPNQMAVRNDWPELLSIIQKGLDSITVAERTEIFRRWLGSEVESGQELALTRDERAWLASHREVRLGVDPAWPPFEFIDENGVYSGVVSGYVEALSERTGLAMTPVPDLTWSEVLDKARAGEIDVVPGITPTPARAEFLNFTEPVVTFPIVIVTRKDAHYVSGIEGLLDSKIAVVRSYVTEELLRQDYPDLELHLQDSVADGLRALDAGEIDALVANLAAATFEIDRLGIDSLKIAAPTDYKHALSMGVRKDWPELVGILDKALVSLTDAERTAIKNAWVTVTYSFGLDTDKILVWAAPIGSAILIVIGMVLWWNRKLGAQIAVTKKAEAELAEAENKVRTALDNMPGAMFMLDKDLKFVVSNSQTSAMWGLPEDFIKPGMPIETVVRSIAELGGYPEKDVERAVESRLALIRDPDPEGSETTLPSGRHVVIRYSVTEDGGRVAVVSDITERKKAEVEIQETKERLEGAYDLITSSIQYASRIQRALLPSDGVLRDLCPEHFCIWEPRDVVGGDMYWVGEDRHGYVVCLFDCTGHGVPGALMTTIAVSALSVAFAETGDPSRLIARVNKAIKQALGQHEEEGPSDDGLEMGICLVEPERGRVTFAGARFELLSVVGDSMDVIKGDKHGVGYRRVPFESRFTNHSIRLKPGQRLYMYSDGIIDQIGGNRRRAFGRKRLMKLLRGLAHMPLPKQGAAIVGALADYQGGEARRDDVSMIGFMPTR
ncbi:MAG: transporter substrate-binding domain-containing protein, partial [Kiloniellales bacterium]|nr:transporter substrate-binding domain-containing protein [Kiloniellales bacterium]